jgi:hypothetical protein
MWLSGHLQHADTGLLLNRLIPITELTARQITELSVILHQAGEDETLLKMASMPELYRMNTVGGWRQADIAVVLLCRSGDQTGRGRTTALVEALRELNLDAPTYISFTPIVPRLEEDRRALLRAVDDALERNPSEGWRQMLTEWSEKLRIETRI